MNYYGDLTEVLELQFVGERRVILFRCTWFDVYDQKKGVKMDEYGFVDMNPSKTLQYEMGQASKISKHGLIQPGALAEGLGQSLKVMSTTRVNAEQRTSISKNRSYNATTSKLNKLVDNSFHVHPCFDEKEDNAPFHQGTEMNQYTLTSGATARGQTLGINVEKSTLIDKNRSNTTTSSRNKSAKTSILVAPNFYQMEDDDTLFQESKVTRDAQRSDNLKKS
ncbi:hypothetical protein MTR67_039344 [Solanum verrucosum]|uniref:DUF4216 domain-containing protein n=1 Tax=Solanum verrucosum TaxID=315347 RepID=A0AAF0UIP7_SOLVR|nr:hypothetical protein MTR67_039344 [Solanum verrucosum]